MPTKILTRIMKAN